MNVTRNKPWTFFFTNAFLGGCCVLLCFSEWAFVRTLSGALALLPGTITFWTFLFQTDGVYRNPHSLCLWWVSHVLVFLSYRMLLVTSKILLNPLNKLWKQPKRDPKGLLRGFTLPEEKGLIQLLSVSSDFFLISKLTSNATFLVKTTMHKQIKSGGFA